ncbi:hypothetical protein [Demequina muriae]|uniref:Uncharacterized protein n=1 Tax=Demequina muriae TaxID=3051664 RepID=A0ABT8GDF9_9MICO|nr:hypothetical protein [Demequina sp. EGI L300058]MDN4479467.1 hypothetical protein [Demequina sp. EGI L300058]
MTGVDYELLEQWEHQGYSNSHHRRKPVRLNDREALLALLRMFERFAGTNEFMVSANEEDFDSTLPFDELVNIFPKYVTVFHLQHNEDPHMVVRLTSWAGGQTWVDAPGGDAFASPLRSLVGVVESNSRPLGIRHRISKSKWKWLARKSRVSVIERSGRDVIAERRHDLRTAMIGGGFGLFGGVLGALIAFTLDA